MSDPNIENSAPMKLFVHTKTGEIYAEGIEWEHRFGAVALHIGAKQNPVAMRQAIEQYRGVACSNVDYSEITNVDIVENKILFQADPDSIGYEAELTFAEFAPILEAWEKAWAAAQAYRATLSKG